MYVIRIILCLLIFPGLSQAERADNIRIILEGVSSVEIPMVAGRHIQSPKYLNDFYALREYKPIWTDEGPLVKELPLLVKSIQDSALHGLNPERYHLSILSGKRTTSAIGLELLATDAFLTQFLHRSGGVVLPAGIDPDWHLVPILQDPVAVLNQLSETGYGVAGSLDKLWPNHSEYRALLRERSRILSLGEVMTVQVPGGPILKPGHSNERVALLKTRLLGPDEHSNNYDEPLRLAVQAFQTAAGLEPDGMVGEATLELLNATPVNWIDRIDANLESWRWLPHDQPPLMLRVNIAAFDLRAIRNSENDFTMKVVVGRPYRNTPVFTETLKYMVINPYWNVPFKLATVDKLPILKTDPMKLNQQGFEVKMSDSDQFVPVSDINWLKVTRRGFNCQLRQRPGPNNALGQVKFMLPNRFSVYLHDTNDRTLFNKSERSFSSGCIRLSEPVKLAQWLLNIENRPKEAAGIELLIAKGQTTTIHFKQPVPVYIVYFTAYMDDTGDIVFRKDLYQRDKVIVEGLRKSSLH